MLPSGIKLVIGWTSCSCKRSLPWAFTSLRFCCEPASGPAAGCGAAWIILQLLHSSQSSQAAPVNSMVSFNVIKIACLLFAVSGNAASLRGDANAQSAERKLERYFLLPESRNFRSQSEERNLATFDSIINLLLNHH